jgi:hypothetical protein
MSGDRPIIIDEGKRIASGKWRTVYLHPGDETKVLKLYRESGTPAARRARHWTGRLVPERRFDANARDIGLYRKLAAKPPEVRARVGAVYGYVATDRGPALMAEHVRDADGRTSVSLRRFVAENGLAGLAPLIEDFFETMAAHHVPVEDPSYHNILVQRREGGGLRLVLVDGLGDPTVIPYKSLIKGLNRKKLMRKKERLLARLERVAAEAAAT